MLYNLYTTRYIVSLMAEITLKGYKCERCNHTWVPREEHTPLVCPKCKSPYWNKPRQTKKSMSWKDKKKPT